MHILQLLTTVDEGIQAIGKTLELLHMMGVRMTVTSRSSDMGRKTVHVPRLNLVVFLFFFSFSSAGS